MRPSRCHSTAAACVGTPANQCGVAPNTTIQVVELYKKKTFRVVVNGETFLGDKSFFCSSGGRALQTIFFFSFFNADNWAF